ncbi:hypothetical protein EFP20_17700 [Burkholderia glumae]|nr:hypothetical protein EFP17_23815 [Burkholderia glumae]UVT03269.1 hypothetical protein EFP20_17700 [Burkholderia glumae]
MPDVPIMTGMPCWSRKLESGSRERSTPCGLKLGRLCLGQRSPLSANQHFGGLPVAVALALRRELGDLPHLPQPLGMPFLLLGLGRID